MEKGEEYPLRGKGKAELGEGGLKQGNDWNENLKWLTSLVIREMHIKMTLRFHLTPIRIAKIKNENDSKFCRGLEKEKHSSIAGGTASW